MVYAWQSAEYLNKHPIMPPLAAEIFGKNQWSDFFTRSLHLLYYDLANYISVVYFLVEPFIAALPALFDCTSHAGEQFPIGMAIVVLAVFFFVLYHIRCRTPRIVQCREWWLCLLRGRSFSLPYLQVLEFYKYHTLFKSLFRVADLALFYPKVVFAEAIDEVSVKVATKSICRDSFPQFLFVFCKHYAVYQFKDCFTHLIVKIEYQTFNYYVHNRWVL